MTTRTCDLASLLTNRYEVNEVKLTKNIFEFRGTKIGEGYSLRGRGSRELSVLLDKRRS